jgi:hypothetical protein
MSEIVLSLLIKPMHHEIADVDGTYTLREPSEAYVSDFGR